MTPLRRILAAYLIGVLMAGLAGISVALGHYGTATFAGLVAIGAWITMNMFGSNEGRKGGE